MSKQPYHHISFEWLGNESNSDLSMFENGSESETQNYELPSGFGIGHIETIPLALGMTIFRAEHRFQSCATGHIIPAGDVRVTMNEPTFQAQIIRGGRVLEKQITPSASLLLSPGIDLFRYSKKYHITPSLDGSSNSQMTCISIGKIQLENLIGDEDAQKLLTSLDLLPMPRVTAKEVPLHISSYLHASINNALIGSARKLHCQARALDYLSALIEHLKSTNSLNAISPQTKTSKKRSHSVYEYLINAKGKLPTLDGMAKLFGCSARTLNDEFSAEYGQSIHSFITNQRLLAAHELIKNSGLALKEVSFRLGYAHVNHFITAFKNKFGYPPGSLRK